MRTCCFDQILTAGAKIILKKKPNKSKSTELSLFLKMGLTF